MNRTNGLLALIFGLVATLALAQTGPADPLWELYKEGRFEEVVARGKALINTGEGTAQVQLAVGRALADQGSFAEAAIFLEGAAEADPEHTWVYAWAQVYLGNCSLQQGDRERARRHWIAARDAGATRNTTRAAVSALSGFGLAESFDTWDRFTTDNFEFLFSDQLVALDRTGFAREHEEAYAAISAWFGGGPDRPILFIVWSDQEEATAAGMPQLGFARPELNLVHCLVQQTVGHEMTHVISYHALNPVERTGLINEGTAVHFDQAGRDQLVRAQEALAASAAPPVAMAALWEDWSLLPSEISYPVAGAWVGRLLDKGGQKRFLEFFPDQRLANARAVYGSDLEVWLQEFDGELQR